MTSAADRREELEARLWQAGLPVTAVEHILQAADTYAEAVAEERIDGRNQLARAAAGLGPPVHYRGVYGPTACRATWKRQPRYVTRDPAAVTCNGCKRSRGYKDDAREAA